MKTIIISIFVFVFLAGFTVSYAEWKPFETIDQSRERHIAESYNYKKEHGTPSGLGVYPQRLGDPAPRNTFSPDFQSPSRNDTWQNKSMESPWSPSRNKGKGFLD